MPKNGFPTPTAKNGFHILNLHPKKYRFKKSFFFFSCQFTRKIPQFLVHIATVYFNDSTKDFTPIHLVTFSI